jgi:hemerythrin
MFIEWSQDFEIKVPVVDAEHKYLVQLVNDLHAEFTNDNLDNNLIDIFTHLASYAKKHFANEESVMDKVTYPEIEEHKKEHRELLQTARKLSVQYLDGSKSITADTMNFLKTWVLSHIIESDYKIGKFVELNPLPSDWEPGAAFSEKGRGIFKHCTFCGKNWHTFKEFANDKEKKVIGYNIDEANHMYNLIYVNHICGTTLGFLLSDFIGTSEIPFVLEERKDRQTKPSYCLKEYKGTSCHPRCACKYTNEILKILNYKN